MSFARSVKDELAQAPYPFDAARLLLAGIVRAVWRAEGVALLEHAGTARLAFRLAKERHLAPHLERRRRRRPTYALTFGAEEERLRRELGVGPAGLQRLARGRWRLGEAMTYVRGVFLAAGHVTDPSRAYHLEFVLQDAILREELLALLGRRYQPHVYVRRGASVLYVKGGDAIAELFGRLGAPNALLAFVDVRIRRGVRDEVNRLVNAETANVERTVEASLRQVRAVLELRKDGRIERLPEALRETAELRVRFPEATLQELAELLALSKSGVNHRLRRLVRLAESRRG